MAIRAADDAFLDLRQDPLPRYGTTRHVAHVRHLIVEVIEIENADITFSAIDTWMRGEVRDQRKPIAATIARVVASTVLAVPFEVFLVAFLVV
jgi:hypothetical protein